MLMIGKIARKPRIRNLVGFVMRLETNGFAEVGNGGVTVLVFKRIPLLWILLLHPINRN
jgi:hypothetical protein